MIDGGLAGLFWAYIWNFIGFSFVVLSLAEMASMYGSFSFNILPSLLTLSSQGTNCWRSISLGLWICAPEVPEVFELYDRYVGWLPLAYFWLVYHCITNMGHRMDVNFVLASWECFRVILDRHHHPSAPCDQLSRLQSYRLARNTFRLRNGTSFIHCQHLGCSNLGCDTEYLNVSSCRLLFSSCHHSLG